jgi:hypothetical protein
LHTVKEKINTSAPARINTAVTPVHFKQYDQHSPWGIFIFEKTAGHGVLAAAAAAAAAAAV